MAGPAAPDKKRIAEAIEVFQAGLVRYREGHALGPAANRTADMQLGIQPRTARQHERSQGREVLIHTVNLPLELCSLGVGDAGLPGMHILRQRGED